MQATTLQQLTSRDEVDLLKPAKGDLASGQTRRIEIVQKTMVLPYLIECQPNKGKCLGKWRALDRNCLFQQILRSTVSEVDNG